jgi:O-antigen/teichoic acid export membrane protein
MAAHYLTSRARARRTWRALARLRRDSLLRNSGALMLTTVTTSLLGYGYWLVAAHLYSPGQIGAASATLALIGLASTLCGGGLAAAVVHRLPRCATSRAWSSAVVAALLLGAVAALLASLLLVALLVWLPWVPVLPRRGAEVALLLCSAPVWAAAALTDAVFVSQRRAERVLARNAVFALAKIPLMAVPALLGAGTAISLVCSWTSAAASSVLLTVPFVAGRRGLSRPAWRQIGSEGGALLRAFGGQQWIGIGGTAWMYVLPVLVTWRCSSAENAYSSVTWMSGGLLFMVSASVSLALFAEGAHAPRTLAATVRAGIRIVAALLAPAIAIYVLAGGSLLAIFGAAYARHGTVLLVVLAVAAVPDAITNVAVGAWRVQGRLLAATLLNLGMTALALTLAWLWLPRHGIAGAGVAWLIAQSTGSIAVLLTLRRPPPDQHEDLC